MWCKLQTSHPDLLFHRELHQQAARDTNGWSLRLGDLPASHNSGGHPVDNGWQALAEGSGFLHKASLLQWCWRLANHRGNILIFVGFNSFNYIYGEFSNRWVYKCAKKNRNCVCKINFTGYREAPVHLSSVNLELLNWAASESNYHPYRQEIRMAGAGGGRVGRGEEGGLWGRQEGPGIWPPAETRWLHLSQTTMKERLWFCQCKPPRTAAEGK